MKTKLFNKDFVLLFLACFLITVMTYLLVTTMARYAVLAFACSDSIAGLSSSIFLIASMFGRIINGRIADLWGHKRATVISMAVMTIACCLYFLTPMGVGVLLPVRFLHGLGFGIASTLIPAMVMSALPPERLGEGTGVFMLSTTLGAGIGPLAALLVTAGADYRIMFALSVAVVGVGLLACCLIGVGARDPELAEQARNQPVTLGSFVDVGACRIGFFMFLVAFANSTINTFAQSFAAEIGLDVYAPFIFVLYSLTTLFVRPACGRILDRHGENRVLYPCITAMALALLLIASAQGPVMLVATGAFMALGYGATLTSGQAAVTKHVDPQRIAVSLGTYYLLCDLGAGIGPYLMGFVITGTGYRVMYVVAAGIALLGLLYYHLVHGRTARAEDGE